MLWESEMFHTPVGPGVTVVILPYMTGLRPLKDTPE